MSGPGGQRVGWETRGVRATALSREQERLRPLYSRILGLRHVDPGALLCFVFFEGSVILALLLALAELVSWWTILVLPATVAVLVKVNDEVAAAVARSAARVPERERERFRRQMTPAVGRAAVPPRVLPAGTAHRAVPAGTAHRVALPAGGERDETGGSAHDKHPRRRWALGGGRR